jgi:hypothetical protein
MENWTPPKKKKIQKNCPVGQVIRVRKILLLSFIFTSWTSHHSIVLIIRVFGNYFMLQSPACSSDGKVDTTNKKKKNLTAFLFPKQSYILWDVTS